MSKRCLKGYQDIYNKPHPRKNMLFVVTKIHCRRHYCNWNDPYAKEMDISLNGNDALTIRPYQNKDEKDRIVSRKQVWLIGGKTMTEQEFWEAGK